jgi:hypothetical protein
MLDPGQKLVTFLLEIMMLVLVGIMVSDKVIYSRVIYVCRDYLCTVVVRQSDCDMLDKTTLHKFLWENLGYVNMGTYGPCFCHLKYSKILLI